MSERKKVTINTLIEMKQKSEKITMLTCYDFLMATMLDEAGIDMVLVGDSLANVVLGYESTIPVTMEEMLHHCKAVTRGIKNAFVVGDMPFMSYQTSSEEALKNAGRLLKEARVSAIKLEGGEEVLETIKKIVDAGIPVMGHLGLTPQSVNVFGGYGLRGSTKEESEKIINDAGKIEKAGVFAIVLEKIPSALAKEITDSVKVPTIGIGAGSDCDGQVLVAHDMLGLFERYKPKFVKRYAEIARIMKKCFNDYIREVKSKEFPAQEHSY
ncbi:MAG TPA: 3-methyl-2-oxobutanoate hydroxymethyltransferase [Actinobacteria bacterium]|nr:3-methyl-2-oxobutanoate hydroxymethyltransferase [Actinomycetota bacterium]